VSEPNPSPVDDTADPAAAGAKTADTPMIPKARLDEEIGKRRALEEELSATADALLAEVPEHLKALIPADLGPAAKIKWFREARKTGVFGGTTQVPETDSGKPKVTPRDQDLSTLPPVARMARAYGTK